MIINGKEEKGEMEGVEQNVDVEEVAEIEDQVDDQKIMVDKEEVKERKNTVKDLVVDQVSEEANSRLSYNLII